MEAVLNKISSFITSGLSFVGIFGTDEWSYEAVLGEATQVVMQLIATILLFIFIRIFIWKRIMNILINTLRNHVFSFSTGSLRRTIQIPSGYSWEQLVHQIRLV